MTQVEREGVLPFLLSAHAAEPVLQVPRSTGSEASTSFSWKRGEVGFHAATGMGLTELRVTRVGEQA